MVQTQQMRRGSRIGGGVKNKNNLQEIMDLKAEDENLKAFDKEFEHLREADDLLDEEDLNTPQIGIDDLEPQVENNFYTQKKGNFADLDMSGEIEENEA